MISWKRIASVTATMTAVAAIGLGIMGYAAGVRAVPVMTGSMRPNYPAGTLVFTHKANTGSLKKGDVIAFAPPAPFTTPGNKPVMHRIIQIERIGTGTYVKTRGDNNAAPDAWTLDIDATQSDKLWFAVPYFGELTAALRDANRVIAGFTIGGLLMIAAAFVLWPQRRDRREVVNSGYRFETSEIELTQTGPLYGSASHEIRSALTHVATSVELARDEESVEGQKELLEIAVRGTERLTHVIEKLLFAFGIEQWKAESRVGIEKVVRGAMADLQISESRVWLTGSPVSSMIMANEVALRRAVHGMLEHALFASGDSDDVMVEIVECTDTVTVIVSASPNEEMAYRLDTWPKESALNLALVQRVANDHGGTVKVETKLGGVYISLTVPLVRQPLLAG